MLERVMPTDNAFCIEFIIIMVYSGVSPPYPCSDYDPVLSNRNCMFKNTSEPN